MLEELAAGMVRSQGTVACKGTEGNGKWERLWGAGREKGLACDRRLSRKGEMVVRPKRDREEWEAQGQKIVWSTKTPASLEAGAELESLLSVNCSWTKWPNAGLVQPVQRKQSSHRSSLSTSGRALLCVVSVQVREEGPRHHWSLG